MTMPEQTFKVDLEAFHDQVEGFVGKFRRAILLSLFDKIIRRTPVDTGRARMSWQVSDESPSTYVPPSATKSAGAFGDAMGAGDVGGILNLSKEPYLTSYITSNLPYIVPLEYGWSGQAPAGMVRISIVEIEAELQMIADRLT